jgi:hypothetical protein
MQQGRASNAARIGSWMVFYVGDTEVSSVIIQLEEWHG